jgi:hypothetical protein
VAQKCAQSWRLALGAWRLARNSTAAVLATLRTNMGAVLEPFPWKQPPPYSLCRIEMGLSADCAEVNAILSFFLICHTLTSAVATRVDRRSPGTPGELRSAERVRSGDRVTTRHNTRAACIAFLIADSHELLRLGFLLRGFSFLESLAPYRHAPAPLAAAAPPSCSAWEREDFGAGNLLTGTCRLRRNVSGGTVHFLRRLIHASLRFPLSASWRRRAAA